MTTIPLSFRWTGDVMEPLKGLATKEANERFVIGDVYRLVDVMDRSVASHNHQFAEIAEAWRNLPEHLAEMYPTPERLRKTALIRCGFATSRQFVASSKAEAVRIAAFLHPAGEYTIVTVRGCVVTEFTAMSQSRRAMGAKQFQESKQAVLDFVAGMINVGPSTLTKEAGRAA